MTDVWVAFWVGMFLGAWAGVFSMAMCVIAGRADDRKRRRSFSPPNPTYENLNQLSIARNESRVLLERQES